MQIKRLTNRLLSCFVGVRILNHFSLRSSKSSTLKRDLSNFPRAKRKVAFAKSPIFSSQNLSRMFLTLRQKSSCRCPKSDCLIAGCHLPGLHRPKPSPVLVKLGNPQVDLCFPVLEVGDEPGWFGRLGIELILEKCKGLHIGHCEEILELLHLPEGTWDARVRCSEVFWELSKEKGAQLMSKVPGSFG